MDLNTARAALTAAINARTEVEGRHDESRGALNAATVVSENKRAAAELAANAEQAGDIADAPALAQARHDAEATAAAATRQVARARGAHEITGSELARARRAVEIAAEAVLEAENEILVGQADRLLSELTEIGKKLHLPSEIDTPINKFHTREAKIARAVERLLATMQDDLHTPVNRLASLRGRPESEYRICRRAALIAGADPDAPGSDDAQAAA